MHQVPLAHAILVWKVKRFSALKECVDDLMAIENGVPDKNLSLIGRWRELPDFPDEETEFPDNEALDLQERWMYAVNMAEKQLNWEEEPMRLVQSYNNIGDRKKTTSWDRIMAVEREQKLFHSAAAIMVDLCIPCFRAGFYTTDDI